MNLKNRSEIQGRVTKDVHPEKKDGKTYETAFFTLQWLGEEKKGKDGNSYQPKCSPGVSVFGKDLIEKVRNLKAGDLIEVVGKLRITAQPEP